MQSGRAWRIAQAEAVERELSTLMSGMKWERIQWIQQAPPQVQKRMRAQTDALAKRGEFPYPWDTTDRKYWSTEANKEWTQILAVLGEVEDVYSLLSYGYFVK